MSNRYERRPPERRPPERRRSRVGCLAWLVALVWIALLGLLAYRYWVRPQVSRYIGSQIAEQLGSNRGGPLGSPIPEGAQHALPTVVAALPSGELRISEADANAYFAAHADAFKPAESITVRFVPDEVQADIRALGAVSTARLGLVAQNGRIVAQNPRIDGPLDQVISLPDLTAALERQFNDQIAAQGRRATDVRVEQGELIIKIEN
jgi:hypothetical protein